MSVGAVEVHERQALVSLRDTVLQTGRDPEILHLHRERQRRQLRACELHFV